ncbi:(2Fe-2S)-binding protein [bacterium]|nr:(2Fe-2S)-binding protein [bacterium]
MDKEDIIICRCEDVSLKEIRKAISDGYTDFEELKRFLRVGMGPCGGRTCLPIIRKELAKYLKKEINELELPSKRPPTQVTTFSAIAKGSERGQE